MGPYRKAGKSESERDLKMLCFEYGRRGNDLSNTGGLQELEKERK